MQPQRVVLNGQLYVLAAEVPTGFTPAAFSKWKHDVRAVMAQRLKERPERAPLVEAVLANGGVAVQFSTSGHGLLDHFLPQLLDRGKLRRMSKRPLLLDHPGKALPTALAMWQADPTRYGVEVGVVRDEHASGTASWLWTEHAWLFDMPGQRYVEPERLRTQYYGCRLSDNECKNLHSQMMGNRQVQAAVTEHPLFKLVKDALPQANQLGTAVWQEHGRPNHHDKWLLPVNTTPVPASDADGKGPKGSKLVCQLLLSNYEHDPDYQPPEYLEIGSLKFMGTDDGKCWDTKQVRNQSLWQQLKTVDQLAKRIVAYLFTPKKSEVDVSEDDD